MIVEALMNGISSIVYIGIILLIWIYFFAIVGMLLFGDIDPWHFGSLHSAMLTLFQCLTLDGWSVVMKLSMYGCFLPLWWYEEWGIQPACDPTIPGRFIFAALFFSIFTFVGGFLLLTLFIGVVGLSMEVCTAGCCLLTQGVRSIQHVTCVVITLLTQEATAKQRDQELVVMKTKKVAEEFELDSYVIQLYREVFNMVDFSKSDKIGKDELRFGVKVSSETRSIDSLFVNPASLDCFQSTAGGQRDCGEGFLGPLSQGRRGRQWSGGHLTLTNPNKPNPN